jgi:hypothetical protein
MLEKITEFLDNKGIKDEFIRNIVSRFIIGHTELYGDVVSFESLIDRLNSNLNSINLIEPSNDLKYKNVVGQYEGFDKGTIYMFFSQDHLKNPQLREDFMSILLHELTHCAYTIKQNDIYKSEKQIFGTYEKSFDGKTNLTNGNSTYMEPIVNYVSSCIYGKKNSAYSSQTINFTKLTSLINDKELIKSAFNSDEKTFKQCFDVLPEGAYEYFTKGMDWLNSGGQIGFRRGSEIMNNFFSGNIPSLSDRQKKIKEFQSFKSELNKLQSLQEEQEVEKGFTKIKSKGIIDALYLSVIVLVFCCIMLTFQMYFIK